MDVRGALLDGLADERVHELDDRGLGVEAAAQRDLDLGLGLLEVDNGLIEAVQARDQRGHILAGGGGRSHLHPGDHLDLVQCLHVRGVGHGQQHAAIGEQADRDGAVAARDRGRDQRDGTHVDLEYGQVDEVKAEPLGERSGELVVADYPAIDQHLAGREALRAGDVDRLLDNIARGQAEVDDHLADQPLGSPTPGGRDQPAGVVVSGLADRGGGHGGAHAHAHHRPIDIRSWGLYRSAPGRTGWPDPPDVRGGGPATPDFGVAGRNRQRQTQRARCIV